MTSCQETLTAWSYCSSITLHVPADYSLLQRKRVYKQQSVLYQQFPVEKAAMQIAGKNR